MNQFVTIVLAITAVTLAVVTVATWVTGPSLALLGPLHYMTLVPSLAGFVLLVVEWRTKGAHQLCAIGITLVAVSLLMGLIAGATGMRMMFTALTTDAVVSDATQFRRMMSRGLIEASSMLQRHLAMGALQLVLWVMMRKPDARAE